ncbi:MAG: hypothetical protein JW894_04280 [Bacteroidales bacterium]|nr:hypothetical protein [Bacteroidales bacterium]
MTKHNVRLEYSRNKYQIVLQSSNNDDEFYGLDKLELKKLHIIQAKFGCRHFFHVLPDYVTLDLHPFTWDKDIGSFKIEENKKVKIRLNTLQEAVVYHPLEEFK